MLPLELNYRPNATHEDGTEDLPLQDQKGGHQRLPMRMGTPNHHILLMWSTQQSALLADLGDRLLVS